eukprot:4325441-Pleurochrysis_carterae.AAC.1
MSRWHTYKGSMSIKALQQLPDRTRIGGQSEEAPRNPNRNSSTSSQKGPESWLRLAEKKGGAGTSSNASDNSCSTT